jgi:hypothetical protein
MGFYGLFLLVVFFARRVSKLRIVSLWPPSVVASVRAARAAVGRTDGCFGIHGPRGGGAHGYFIRVEDLAERNRALMGRNMRFGADLVWWPRAPFGEVPRRPEPTPWIPPQAGPTPFWDHQHTSWVLGVLFECIACASGACPGPCAMTGPRAMRGAERAHDPRRLQTRRNFSISSRRLNGVCEVARPPGRKGSSGQRNSTNAGV